MTIHQAMLILALDARERGMIELAHMYATQAIIISRAVYRK